MPSSGDVKCLDVTNVNQMPMDGGALLTANEMTIKYLMIKMITAVNIYFFKGLGKRIVTAVGI